MFTRSQYINAILFILLIGVIIGYVYSNSKKIEKFPMYSVGIVKKFRESRGAPCIFYKFNVNNKTFHEMNIINYIDEKLIGKRFLVKFYKIDPSLSEILLYYPISDRSIVVPSEGWKEIPDFLPH